jgi:malic enzyme
MKRTGVIIVSVVAVSVAVLLTVLVASNGQPRSAYYGKVVIVGAGAAGIAAYQTIYE